MQQQQIQQLQQQLPPPALGTGAFLPNPPPPRERHAGPPAGVPAPRAQPSVITASEPLPPVRARRRTRRPGPALAPRAGCVAPHPRTPARAPASPPPPPPQAQRRAPSGGRQPLMFPRYSTPNGQPPTSGAGPMPGPPPMPAPPPMPGAPPRSNPGKLPPSAFAHFDAASMRAAAAQRQAQAQPGRRPSLEEDQPEGFAPPLEGEGGDRRRPLLRLDSGVFRTAVDGVQRSSSG